MKINFTLFSVLTSFLLLFSGGIINAQTNAERQSKQNKSNIAALTILEADLSQQYDSQRV